MRKTTLRSVKQDGCILITNGKYVLSLGKRLWIFRTDGTFVVKPDAVRYPFKVAFLLNNCALIECRGTREYQYISLETGETLWRIPKPRKFNHCALRFATSSDKNTVYDIWYEGMYKLHVLRFLIDQQRCDDYVIDFSLRVTGDIFCDANDILHLCQYHLILDSPVDREHQYGIMAIPFVDDKPAPYWKKEWKMVPQTGNPIRACNEQYVFFADLTYMDLNTHELFSLISEEDRAQLPPYGMGNPDSYDEDTKLLTIHHTIKPVNYVIDCGQKKIVARYERTREEKLASVGFVGCLVENEFWTGSLNGIIRRPFPHID